MLPINYEYYEKMERLSFDSVNMDKFIYIIWITSGLNVDIDIKIINEHFKYYLLKG